MPCLNWRFELIGLMSQRDSTIFEDFERYLQVSEYIRRLRRYSTIYKYRWRLLDISPCFKVFQSTSKDFDHKLWLPKFPNIYDRFRKFSTVSEHFRLFPNIPDGFWMFLYPGNFDCGTGRYVCDFSFSQNVLSRLIWLTIPACLSACLSQLVSFACLDERVSFKRSFTVSIDWLIGYHDAAS